jgi:cytochrome c oxidase subunit 2
MNLALSILPERASNHAGSVDAIFYSLLALCGLVTLAVVAALVFCCLRYRLGTTALRGEVADAKSRNWIEITWSSLTLAAFVGIFFWAGVVYFRMYSPPVNAAEIHVVARQWMWKAQHGNGRHEINELHLLVNQPVKLIMTSQDVIHDFFVPAFRTKQDVLPGRYTSEWFIPTKPGTYHLYCAEYCGMDHSRMGGWVYVQEAQAYTRWLAGASETESIVAGGQRLFIARGCAGCHAPHAAVRAPLLDGIYRKPVALADGSVVIADEQYLHDSILLPNKQVTAGYEPKMPTYQGQLSEEEVLQIIAYLKSLTDSAP